MHISRWNGDTRIYPATAAALEQPPVSWSPFTKSIRHAVPFVGAIKASSRLSRSTASIPSARANRGAGLDLGKSGRVRALRIGRNLIELRQVLLDRHILGDDRQDLAPGVGGENHGGGQPGDAILLGRVGVVIVVDFTGTKLASNAAAAPGLIANVVFQMVAGYTRAARKRPAQVDSTGLAAALALSMVASQWRGCWPMAGRV